MSTTNSISAKRKRQDSSPEGESEEEKVVFEKIVPNGDVVFVFEQGTKKIQVHSFLMKHASPVFSAMLGVNFKEGDVLQEAALNNRPAEIPLPDDDFEAFKLVCIVIHHQGQTKQHAPSVQGLIGILEVADKYHLLDAISMSFELWVRNHSRTKDCLRSDLWLLMLISYRINVQDLFQAFSKKVALYCRKAYIELAIDSETTISHLIPNSVNYKLAASLEELRKDMLLRIIQIINTDMYAEFRDYEEDVDVYHNILPYYRHLEHVLMESPNGTRLGLCQKVGKNNYSVNDLLLDISKISVDEEFGDSPLDLYELKDRLDSRLTKLKRDFKGYCILCGEENNVEFLCSGVHKD
ncbi:hypothetical protein F66182_5466 [Fusarium sp. NRRL 66182]|nr:hypothetical protein F66182_5466 [Fusarium sp. NRRL 66182]